MSAIVSAEETSNILNVASTHGTAEKPVEKNLHSITKDGEKRNDPTEILSNIAQLTLSQNDVAKETTDLMNKLILREKTFSSAVNDFQVYCSQVMESVEDDARQIRASATAEAALLVAEAKKEIETWEAEKVKLSLMNRFDGKVKLDVGGHRFTTSLTTLRRFPDTMIGAMFSGRHAFQLDDEGYYFIDRDGTHFRLILNFLRSPETFRCELTGPALNEFKNECDYYALNELVFPFKPVPAFKCYTSSGLSVTITQDEAGVWHAQNTVLKVCEHCFCAEYQVPASTTNETSPPQPSFNMGASSNQAGVPTPPTEQESRFVFFGANPPSTAPFQPAPFTANAFKPFRYYLTNFQKTVEAKNGSIDFSIQPKPTEKCNNCNRAHV